MARLKMHENWPFLHDSTVFFLFLFYAAQRSQGGGRNMGAFPERRFPRRSLHAVSTHLQRAKTCDRGAHFDGPFSWKMPDFSQVFAIFWRGARAGSPGAIKKNEKKLKKTLAQILAFAKKRAAL